MPAQLPDVLRIYGLVYFYENLSSISYNAIIGESLNDNYPVAGVFSVAGGSNTHCTVIYGINVIAGRIRVMDPQMGMFDVHQTSAGYTYTSSYANTVLTLAGISFVDNS